MLCEVTDLPMDVPYFTTSIKKGEWEELTPEKILKKAKPLIETANLLAHRRYQSAVASGTPSATTIVL